MVETACFCLTYFILQDVSPVLLAEQDYRRPEEVPGPEPGAGNCHILLLMHINAHFCFRFLALTDLAAVGDLACVSLGTCAADFH